jgi:subtilase family serine protease
MKGLQSLIAVVLLTFPSLTYGQGSSAKPDALSAVGLVRQDCRLDFRGHSSSLKPTDTLYLDWAVLNSGTAATGADFLIKLYVDGLEKQTWTSSSLNANFYTSVEDYSVGPLAAGTHTLKIVADTANAIAESNEADNEYTKVIMVALPANLTPFQPTGWSDKIVVSTVTGTNTDNSSLKTTDILYVDWAVINNGQGPTTVSFQTTLYVDGQQRGFWTSNPPVDPNFYQYIQDYSIGSLGAGSHSIRIMADPLNAIAETNETDNDYTKTIFVAEAAQCFTLLTAVTPAGSGTIAKGQPPNCGGSAFSFNSNVQSVEPLLLTADSTTNLPATPKRSLATLQNFASLKAKTRSQGRVNVIVASELNSGPRGC